MPSTPIDNQTVTRTALPTTTCTLPLPALPDGEPSLRTPTVRAPPQERFPTLMPAIVAHQRGYYRRSHETSRITARAPTLTR
jgi:hypothetical protein